MNAYFNSENNHIMKHLLLISILSLLIPLTLNAQEPLFLERSLSGVSIQKSDLTGNSAEYQPIFGTGDYDSKFVKGISRFGCLTIESGGSSKIAGYDNEEHILFILEGTGNMQYNNDAIPVSKNDFIYIPVGVKFGLVNPRERAMKVIIMGFRIPYDTKIKPTPGLMIANTDEVPFQVLGQHGPTTQFQLLMGTTESKRDRLAASLQVNSLFIMDFASGGTNIPHKHEKEEEIYFVIKGTGEMVAGATPDGKEIRYPAKEGDAFYFAPNTMIGFYSATKEGEAHAQILAVRSKFTAAAQDR
jgi:mannose-6-phosphate isomerase-like protein (cupin superfamily)